MKPMLASPAGLAIPYPMLLSPKLDGIRCLVIDGVACGRSLKPIPNKHVQKCFGRPEFNGLDGELIVGDPTAKDVFQVTSSEVMSVEGKPAVTFWVFDDFVADGGFKLRLDSAIRRFQKLKFGPVCIVEHTMISDEVELDHWESKYLADGYEGVMLRHPIGPYKFGRSTAKEAYLLKVKRFIDSEAEVIGCEQLMTNTNEAKTNELGQLERSSHKAGKIGAGTLGSLQVRDCLTGVEFSIGTGFTAEQRKKLWHCRKNLPGQLVKYKSQPVGVKDKPRFPVFLGFRSEVDL